MSEISRGHIQFLLQNDEKVGAQYVFAENLREKTAIIEKFSI